MLGELHNDNILYSDSHWGIWNGGRGDYGVALLVSLITGGYHSSAAYKWTTDEAFLGDEIYPIIYVSKGELIFAHVHLQVWS